jgi:molybdate transport system regulatory protein
LGLDLKQDVGGGSHAVRFHRGDGPGRHADRAVQIPPAVAAEIHAAAGLFARRAAAGGGALRLGPAHVRRKFYEWAAAIGLPRGLGAPEVICRSRAVELMQGNVPLTVVQRILGHASPSLAASWVSCSAEEMRRAEAFFVERENRRRTSARNAFFGRVEALRKGDVHAWVEICTPGGCRIGAVITHHSVTRLGLKPGALVAAEVKAPWGTLLRSADDPACPADNALAGTVECILRGRVASEIVVRIADGTELCAVGTAHRVNQLGLRPGGRVRAAFTAFAVVVHAG